MTGVPPYDNAGELFSGLQERSKKAFEVLYNQQFVSILYFAKRFVEDQQVAEDITTETFLKCWDRLGEFKSIQSIQSFLHITTKNACINHLRDTRRRSANHEQLAFLLEQDSADAIALQQLNAEIYRHIYEEVEKLSPQLKKVFLMSYVEGKSNEEIATELGINNQSVRNDKSRALKQIRIAMIQKGLLGIFLIWLALQEAAIVE